MAQSEHTPHPDGYFQKTKRPLYVLVFLAPLILAYEVGATMLFAGADGAGEVLEARRVLVGFFSLFGVAGLHLPAALLVALLLSWQLIGKYSWTVRPSVLVGMWVESCVWAIPLLLVGPMLGGIGPAVLSDPLGELPWFSRLTLAIGAGLYEELVFRLILIAVVHAVASDLAQLGPKLSAGLAVAISAGVFAGYHRPVGGAIVFYLFAGALFAGVYLGRGFGVAAATHALYDTVALVLLPGLADTASG